MVDRVAPPAPVPPKEPQSADKILEWSGYGLGILVAVGLARIMRGSLAETLQQGLRVGFGKNIEII